MEPCPQPVERSSQTAAPLPAWILVALFAVLAFHPGAIESGIRHVVLSVDAITESVGRAAMAVFDYQNITAAYSAMVSLFANLAGNF